MNWFVDIRSGSDTKPGDTIYLAPGLYDLELEKQIRAARASGLIIAVTGGH